MGLQDVGFQLLLLCIIAVLGAGGMLLIRRIEREEAASGKPGRAGAFPRFRLFPSDYQFKPLEKGATAGRRSTPARAVTQDPAPLSPLSPLPVAPMEAVFESGIEADTDTAIPVLVNGMPIEGGLDGRELTDEAIEAMYKGGLSRNKIAIYLHGGKQARLERIRAVLDKAALN